LIKRDSMCITLHCIQKRARSFAIELNIDIVNAEIRTSCNRHNTRAGKEQCVAIQDFPFE